jgi:2-C-methyl-D-erythritol 4-phosphate cytidylyltransferase
MTDPIPASAAAELAASPTNPAAQPSLWALIPCAGTGSRSGAAHAKQYQNLAGKPMVMHCLDAFKRVAGLAGILVVVAPGNRFFDSVDFKDASVFIAGCGGNTRSESVFNGLNSLKTALQAMDDDWVLVHDAARCLITPAQISALIAACWQDEVGGLLALKIPDTLKSESEGRVNQTIARSGKWLAQTPQMFRLGPLRAALEAAKAAGLSITDESSAMEGMGLRPKLVEGSAENFKVTYPQDFALAQSLLLARQSKTLA